MSASWEKRNRLNGIGGGYPHTRRQRVVSQTLSVGVGGALMACQEISSILFGVGHVNKIKQCHPILGRAPARTTRL